MPLNNPIGMMQGRLSGPRAQLQSFPWDEWRAEFDRAQALGYAALEWLFDVENHTANPLWTEVGLADIRAQMARTGVTVPSVCLNYLFWRPLYRVTPEERRHSEAVLLTVIERAAALRARTVLIPALERAGLRTAQEQALLANSLRAPLALAETLGVTIALETDLPAAEAVQLCAAIHHPQLGLYYDSGNAAALGFNPAEELAVVTPWLRGVHIKDRPVGGGNVPLGTGAVHFPAFFAALAGTPYTGPVVLETTPGNDYAEAAQRHVAFVREQLAAAPDQVKH